VSYLKFLSVVKTIILVISVGQWCKADVLHGSSLVRDRPDVDVSSWWSVVRPSCHRPGWVVGATSAGSYLRPEVVEGELIVSGCWVGVPAGVHDGALVGSGVLLVGRGFLWPHCEVF